MGLGGLISRTPPLQGGWSTHAGVFWAPLGKFVWGLGKYENMLDYIPTTSQGFANVEKATR